MKTYLEGLTAAREIYDAWDGWDHHFKEMKYTVLPNARAFVGRSVTSKRDAPK